MGRYQVVPEPRRMWLPLQSKFQPLADSHSSFAAIVSHHTMRTLVKTKQDIESVLEFAVALEAELAALVQDAPSSSKPSVQPHPNPSQPARTEESSAVLGMPQWMIKRGGVRLERKVRSSEHLADKCKRPRKKPIDRPNSHSRGRSQSANRDRSRGKPGTSRSNIRQGSRPNSPKDRESSTAKNASVEGGGSVEKPTTKPTSPKSKAHAKVSVVRGLSAGMTTDTVQDCVLDSGASH
eukprot:6476917-Amphidinium_carterae.3